MSINTSYELGKLKYWTEQAEEKDRESFRAGYEDAKYGDREALTNTNGSDSDKDPLPSHKEERKK